MIFDDNDYDSAENDDLYADLTADIIEEFEYDRKIEIINFFKDKLKCEPEFYAIKNISSGEFLNIIEKNINGGKLNKNDYKLTKDQTEIFTYMFINLNIPGNYNIFNYITKILFKRIYV